MSTRAIAVAVGARRCTFRYVAILAACLLATVGCDLSGQLGDVQTGVYLVNGSGRDLIVEMVADEVRDQFAISPGRIAALSTGDRSASDKRVLFFDQDCTFLVQTRIPAFDYHHVVRIDPDMSVQVGEWKGDLEATFVERTQFLTCSH